MQSSQAVMQSGSDADSVNGHKVIKCLGYDQLQMPDSHWSFKLQGEGCFVEDWWWELGPICLL